MRRTLAPLLWLALLLAAGAPAPAAAQVDVAVEAACRPRAECCKVCNKGQACGDSCISRKKQCHKGQGCACNRADLCP